MCKHGSGFTEQPRSPGSMNPSSLWPLARLGDNVGGDRPEHSLQEDLEPSHTALAAMKLEPASVLSRRSMQAAVFLVLFLSAFCPPCGAPFPFGFRHPWKRGWTEAPRRRLEQKPAGLCLPPGPKGQSCYYSSLSSPLPFPYLSGTTDFRSLPTEQAQPVNLRGK